MNPKLKTLVAEEFVDGERRRYSRALIALAALWLPLTAYVAACALYPLKFHVGRFDALLALTAVQLACAGFRFYLQFAHRRRINAFSQRLFEATERAPL